MSDLTIGCRDLFYAYDAPPGARRGSYDDADPLRSVRTDAVFPGRTTLYIKEVASHWGIHPSHVRNLIDEGLLEAIDISAGAARSRHGTPSRYYRIPVSAVDKFQKEHRS